ncbi:hypothetical protein DN554_30405, partial [Burkholderia multivorans]|uniref:hypothetical protein n=1 Tax=Burkholderia multivorans TaxID=87883 RepID=UPI000DB26E95
TYTITRADAGNRLRLLVWATNRDGKTYAVSSQTVVVPTVLPVNVSPPTINGTLQVGSNLTAHEGVWTSDNGALRYRISWGRCDATGY